jgi:hypothetical protein
MPLPPADRERVEQALQEAQQQLEPGTYEQAWMAGRQMPVGALLDSLDDSEET